MILVGAQSVEHQGVGVHVKSLEKEDILHALVEATTNKDMIIAAKELGKRVDSVSAGRKAHQCSLIVYTPFNSY
jgi:hypothetical protein